MTERLGALMRGLLELTLVVLMASALHRLSLTPTLTDSLPVLTTSMFRGGGWTLETPAYLLARLLPLVVAFALARWRRITLADVHARRLPDRRGLEAAGAFVAAATLVAHLGQALVPGLAAGLIRVYQIDRADNFLVVLCFVVPVYAALGEELWYRAYLQGTHQGAQGAGVVLAVAAYFAWSHAFQGWLAVLAFHLPGALALGCLYRVGRSLPLMVGTHLVFDAIVFTTLHLGSREPALAGALPAVVALLAAAGLGATRRGAVDLGREMASVVAGAWVDRRYLLLAAPLVALVVAALRTLTS